MKFSNPLSKSLTYVVYLLIGFPILKNKVGKGGQKKDTRNSPI